MALVYRHRRLDTNEIFYIGISKNHRRPYRTDGRNNHWRKIYLKSDIEIEIIADNISFDEACELEEFLILEYGRDDLKTGRLVNKTSGGELTKHSDETKEKLRQSKLGEKNHMFGKTQSIETIEKRKNTMLNIVKKVRDYSKKTIQAKKTILIEYSSGKILGVFDSMGDACRFAGLDPKKYSSKASLIARGLRNSIKGFSFKYEE